MNKSGFTLMELLVVLLIIGVLSSVAIRTIDATRDRALFDQTTKELKQLVYAVVGNPDLTMDGRRIDFGFYGDMGRPPNDLRELVENPTSDPHWHGPYIRRELTGDSVGFLRDAWGNPYTYDKNSGVITTVGNGKYPMTTRVADSLPQLMNNTIVGYVTDTDNNPPGDASVGVYLFPSNGGGMFSPVGKGGYYEFSQKKGDTVRVGIHRLVAHCGVTDSIVRWVTVVPRSKCVVDFRFSRPFRNLLKMVGTPRIPAGVDSSGFEFDVVNRHAENITVDLILLEYISDTVYFRTLAIDGSPQTPYYPRPDDSLIGQGETALVDPAVTIAPDLAQRVTFGFFGFASTRSGTLNVNIHGKTFRFRFNDGSEITVKP